MKNFFRAIVALAVFFALNPSSVLGNSEFGYFTSKPEVVVQGERNVQLLKPFTYIDPRGSNWTVPAKTVVNGASIPRMLWTAVGSPWVGGYRQASIVHDYFCESKSKPWKAVHRMFYFAVRAGGVGESKAKLMYAAVYLFGPKWKKVSGADGTKIVTWMPNQDIRKFEQLRRWISDKNPSLNEIESLVQ